VLSFLEREFICILFFEHVELCIVILIEEARPLAPARLHIWASVLAMLIIAATLGEAPLKTQSIWCFQMHQAPRMIREFSPFVHLP
jgi:hypothetical protein